MKYVTNGDNKQRSGFARKIEKILSDLGLAFMPEEPFPPYSVDIYLSEWHIGIEADGPLHNARKDEKRDAYLLEEYGLSILRIPQKNFRTEDAKEAILGFIDEQYEDSETRKRKWLNRL